jgi:hypothetical protein
MEDDYYDARSGDEGGSEEEDPAALLALLARMQGLGVVGERTLNEQVHTTALELREQVQDSPAPRRLVTFAPSPDWKTFSFMPHTLQLPHYFTQVELQCTSASQGGLGTWETLTASSPPWVTFLRRVEIGEAFPYVDCYAILADDNLDNNNGNNNNNNSNNSNNTNSNNSNNNNNSSNNSIIPDILTPRTRLLRSPSAWDEAAWKVRPCVVGAIGWTRLADVVGLMGSIPQRGVCVCVCV